MADDKERSGWLVARPQSFLPEATDLGPGQFNMFKKDEAGGGVRNENQLEFVLQENGKGLG